MNLYLRPASAADAEAIIRLHHDAFHETAAAFYPLETLDAWSSPPSEARYERFRQAMLNGEELLVVAEVDGQVVGFVLGMVIDLMPDIFDQRPSGFLADIYVEPQVRRQGVGRSLVNALVEWFRQCGIHAFDWHVSSNNSEGIAFWRSIGGRDVMIRMRAEVGANND